MSKPGASHFALAVCSVCLAAAGPSSAQEAARPGGERVYQEQLRVNLDEQAVESRELGFDGGGWMNLAFFRIDDASARKTRTLRQYQIRPWGMLNLQNVHKAYVRGLFGYDDWNAGDNPSGAGDMKVSQLERAWYEFDLGQLLKNQTKQAQPFDFRVKVGREYATIGTGLVLATPLDMVQFNGSVGRWEYMALLGKSIYHNQNIDDSAAVADHQERCFYGGQVTYTGLDHHRPFAYFLDNEDNTDPSPLDHFQAYKYTSRYVGGGSTGSLVLPNLRYQAEMAGEFGETYSEGEMDDTDPIRAWCVDGQLEYYFQAPTRPKVSVEYLHGSGDADRRSSATSTIGGNLAGTTDNAFNAFGYRDTGVAFAPAMANLHIYVLGGGFFPLDKIELFHKMELGAKVFFYHKGTESGPISDTTATINSQWVGWEGDVYCNWRITSDVTWTIRYGAFQPGEAFEDERTRNFLLTALTISF